MIWSWQYDSYRLEFICEGTNILKRYFLENKIKYFWLCCRRLFCILKSFKLIRIEASSLSFRYHKIPSDKIKGCAVCNHPEYRLLELRNLKLPVVTVLKTTRNYFHKLGRETELNQYIPATLLSNFTSFSLFRHTLSKLSPSQWKLRRSVTDVGYILFIILFIFNIFLSIVSVVNS